MGKGHDSSCQYASKGRYFGHKKRSITAILRVMLLFFCSDFLFYRWKKRGLCIYYTILWQKNVQNHKKWFWNKWCRWWDLNPHGIATNGFWVRRVCHSTTPANYLIIILYERQKIKPFFESFFQKQEFFLHMIWTVADYIGKENIFVWLLFLCGKLWYNI